MSRDTVRAGDHDYTIRWEYGEPQTMRLFVYAVECEPIEASTFSTEDKTWVAGKFTVHAYAPNGEQVRWTTFRWPPPVGMYVERLVRRADAEQSIPYRNHYWQVEDEKGRFSDGNHS